LRRRARGYSCQISGTKILDILAEKGYVILQDRRGPQIPHSEWESLAYIHWIAAELTAERKLATI